MADEASGIAGEDYVNQWALPDDQPLTEQEQKKLELQKLVAAVKDQERPPIDVTPAQAAAIAQTTMDPNTPDLPQNDYTASDAKIRMLTTKSVPGKTFSPEVERGIEAAAKLNGVDPNVLRGFAAIESAGDPSANYNRGTQYKGLMQIGVRDHPNDPSEWTKYGQDRSPYDPEASADVAAQIMQRNAAWFKKVMGRDPTAADLYLMHQQGPGFFSKGTMTNIAGNLPSDARTPENMTHEGFKRWWTARVNRAIAERGSAPTMRKAQDSNLPSGYLTPEPLANIDGLKGGIPDTPEAQAEIASLMSGKPLAQQSGTAQTAEEASQEARSDPRYKKTRIIPRVGTSKQQRQVEGELPVSVNQTDTLPIPGITTPGQQALMNLAGPSVMSTILAHQGAFNPQEVSNPPEIPVKQPEAQGPSFLDKIMAIAKASSPINWSVDTVKALANAAPGVVKQTLENSPQAIKNIDDIDQQFTRGTVSAVRTMPYDVWASGAGPVVGGAGLLFNNPGMKQYAGQLDNDAQEWRKTVQKSYGIDPNNMTSAESAGSTLGSSLSPNIGKTLVNLAMSTVGDKVLGPASDYMAKNYPVPNLNPIGTANAATVFGNPPTVIQTPAGPQVLNDATLQHMFWGGALSVGFGASIAGASRGVRFAKEGVNTTIPQYVPLVGGKTITIESPLRDIFDPRRQIPNAPGTIGASIPSDLIKAGVVDLYAALMDIADRQVRYDKGVRGSGIDPIAADEVRQKFRIQTNSGAQNLVGNALKEGVIHTDDYRFNVPVPLAKIAAVEGFNDYLKLRIIEEEIAANIISRKQLKTPILSQAQKDKFPIVLKDYNGTNWNLQSNNPTNVRAQRMAMEHNSPELVQAYGDYQKNLQETRNFVSDHHTNNVENPVELMMAALERPSSPIFSAAQNKGKVLERILNKNDDALRVVEDNMDKALTKQLTHDAEQTYINKTQVDLKNNTAAFTPRNKAWVDSPQGQKALADGAILKRRMDGVDRYWTADPVTISIMNSGSMPMSTIGRSIVALKNGFQTTTTGGLAPWFANTGLIRAIEQGWTNAPSNVRDASGRLVGPAGPLSAMAGILGTVVPKGMKFLAPTVDHFETSIHNAFGNALPGNSANVMAKAMMKAYNDSAYKTLKDAGAYGNFGTTLQQGQELRSKVTLAKQRNTRADMNPVYVMMENAMNGFGRYVGAPVRAGRAIKGAYNVVGEGLRAVQEGANMGWAMKVMRGADDINRPTINGRPMSNAEVAARMRNYTGDPSTRGFIYDNNGKLLRFSDPNKGTDVVTPKTAIGRFAKNVGKATAMGRANAYTYAAIGAHGMRNITPWAGVLLQSPASTLKAMRDNPIRANLAFTASHVLPETAAYFWNMAHSNQPIPVLDANGQPVIGPDGKPMMKKGYDYSNYVFQRSENALLNNTYFAVPGEPPENGIEFRHYQEGILQRYMTRAWWLQYFGVSMHTMPEEVANAAMGFLNGAVIPPVAPSIAAGAALYGNVFPEGYMGGTYQKKYNPFLDNGGESNLELVARAFLPSITDIVHQAIHAGSGADSVGGAVKAGVSQTVKRAVARDAIWGPVLGYHPDAAGSNEITQELYNKKHTMDQMLARLRADGSVGTKPGSNSGDRYVSRYLPSLPPNDAKDRISGVGMGQKPSKNPLFDMFIGEMKKQFNTDQPEKGGKGFRSAWKRYGAYGALVNEMRTVDDGTAGAWFKQQEKYPKRMQWLKDQGVDTTDYKKVQNFYQARHMETAKMLLSTIKATEQKIDAMPNVRQMLGDKKFTIEMLDPYKTGLTKPE